jgi:hypothetical protein
LTPEAFPDAAAKELAPEAVLEFPIAVLLLPEAVEKYPDASP